MVEIILQLIAAVTLGAVVLGIYGGAGRWMGGLSLRMRQVVIGLVLGGVSFCSLQLPVTVAPGVIVTSSQVTVALAGLFGGWPGGLIGAAIAMGGRLALGGAGALGGAVSAALAAAVGIGIAEWVRRRSAPLRFWHVALCGFLIVLTSFLTFFLLPADLTRLLFRVSGIPVAVALPLGTMLLGWLLLIEQQNEELRRRLSDNEARMRDVLNNLPGTVYQMRLNTDGTLSYLFASEAIRSSHGITSAEMVANPSLVDSTFLAEDDEGRWNFLRDSAARMKPGQREFRSRFPDGRIRWLRTHSTPKRDAQGRVVWTGFTIDITAERGRDEELHRSIEGLADRERQLRGIVASVPGMVYRFSQTNEGVVRMHFVSDGVRALYGIEPDAALKDSQVFMRCYQPEDEPERRSGMRASAATMSLRERVFRIRRPDGGFRWLHSRSMPHQEPGGEMVWDGVTLDITAQKDMEKELRRSLAERAASEERLRAIIRSMPGAVYQIQYQPDGTSMYTFLSEGIKDLIGYSAEEVMADQSLIHNARLPEDEPERMRAAKESMEAMSLRIREFRGRHRDGSIRWFHSRSMPHLGPSGAVIWDGITMDITDRKRLEEEVRRSEHMLALSVLVDGVAHNFNNLLQIVSGGAELLQEVLNDRKEEQAIAGQILKATGRGARLVQELRRFSHREPASAQSVDVNPLLTDLMELGGHFVGPDVKIELVETPGLWRVAVNPSRLQSTVLSLMQNSRDAMPNGGVIRMATRNITLDEAAARETDQVPGPYVEIRVTDNGAGMAPEILRRATEPFFTTKPANQAGMGLSTVHAYVRQLGGHLAIASQPGMGTEVRLLFPAQDGPGGPRDGKASGDVAQGRTVQ